MISGWVRTPQGQYNILSVCDCFEPGLRAPVFAPAARPPGPVQRNVHVGPVHRAAARNEAEEQAVQERLRTLRVRRNDGNRVLRGRGRGGGGTALWLHFTSHILRFIRPVSFTVSLWHQNSAGRNLFSSPPVVFFISSITLCDSFILSFLRYMNRDFGLAMSDFQYMHNWTVFTGLFFPPMLFFLFFRCVFRINTGRLP